MSILVISKNSKKLMHVSQNEDHKYTEHQFKNIKIQMLNDGVLSNRDKSVGYNENKSIYAFIIGEIYDLEIEKLKQLGHEFNNESDAEYIAHLFEEFGEDVLKKLNGKFVICLVDTLNENVVIVNDRYGAINFYYNIDKEGFIFTNDSKIALSNTKDKTVDEEALKDFSNYGCVIENKTLLKNIKRMDSAGIIKINNENIVMDKYWNWNVKKLANVTLDEAIDKLAELWIEAVRKIVSKHDKFNITITGGLDSRAVVAAIDYLNLSHKINLAYTIGLKGCLDEKIAEKVAKRAGLNYSFFRIDDKQYLDNAFTALDRIICPLNTNYACINILHEKEIFKYPLLSGTFGGETIGGDLQIDGLNYECKDILYSYINNMQSKTYGISNKELLLDQHTLDNENNFNNADKYSSTDFYILDRFIIRNRSAVLFEMMGDNYNSISPFLENSFFDYLFSLPEEWRKNHYIYNKMLLQYFSKFYLDIPWERTKLPIFLNFDRNEIETYSKEVENSVNIRNKDIVIFGASTLGIKTFELLKENYNIIYYCDNDNKKWGSLLNGIEIISPKKLIKLNNISVVVASMYYREIIEQLKILGIDDYTFIGVEEGEVKSYTDFGKWLKNDFVYNRINKEMVNGNISKKYLDMDEYVKKLAEYTCENKGKYEDFLLINSLNVILENLN